VTLLPKSGATSLLIQWLTLLLLLVELAAFEYQQGRQDEAITNLKTITFAIDSELRAHDAKFR